MGWNNERVGAALILIALIVFIFVTIIVPFSGNSLQSGDMPGHVYAAYYIRDNLWPSPIGWDQHFFGGYPLNQFYSPLFSWTVATLGFVMPIEIAFKLLVMLAILLTPLSVYYCARKFKMGPLPAAVVAVLFFTLQFIKYYQWLGLDFESVFEIGLVINAVAVPFLFFYIGRLNTDIKNGRYIAVTVLLALLSLLHIIIGLCAWMFLACYLALNWRQQWKAMLKHIGLTVLLISFWIVPFIAKIAYTDSSSGAVLQIKLGPYDAALLLCAAACIFYLLFKKKDESLTPLVAFFTLLMVVFVVDMVAALPLQLFRIYQVALAISLFIIVKSIARFNPRLLWVPVIVAGILIYLNYGLVDFSGPTELNVFSPLHVDGRVWATVPNPELHALNSIIALQGDNLVARGLFSESAPNSEFYLWLKWLSLYTTNEPLWDSRLDFLGINGVITEGNMVVPYMTKSLIGLDNSTDIFLYKLGEPHLGVPIPYVPQAIQGDWKNATLEWWTGDVKHICVLSSTALPAVVATGQEHVVIDSIRSNLVKVHVDSSSAIPVFLKFSDFPNWHAYANGQPITIYRVLPDFMLVYGAGDIELRYEPLFVDVLGGILSTIGLLVLLGVGFQAFVERYR